MEFQNPKNPKEHEKNRQENASICKDMYNISFHLWRIQHADGGYHYEVDYIVDPQADLLPDNYMASNQRHLALRKAQTEFTSWLTKGLEKKYWRIFEDKEALDLRNKDGLYLPAGFVLKSQGSTRARLVLDPFRCEWCTSKSSNPGRKIASVLRRIHGMPVLFSADSPEAYFRLRVSSASTQ